MSRGIIHIVVGAALVGLLPSIAMASTAGASTRISGGPTIYPAPPLPSSTISRASPSGALPEYGVLYCAKSTVSTALGTVTTDKCIKLISSTEIYFDAYWISGPHPVGHQTVSGNGIQITSPTATYGGHYYYATGPFGDKTYCNTLWKVNITGGYRNLGSVCT